MSALVLANGFTHTVLPLFSRGLPIVGDECNRDGGVDRHAGGLYIHEMTI
jgi:hypothetical protein